jgi:multiple sugar transport system ATP-binding protein
VATVNIKQLTKIYPGKSPLPKPVLDEINLTVKPGELMVLVGPSGCGKSTLLRLIAGLEEVTSGQIAIRDRVVNNIPPKLRNVAMVFQNYALYPHLRVYDNIAFGLRRNLPAHRRSSAGWQRLLSNLSRLLPPSLAYLTPEELIIKERVEQVAQQLQLNHLLDRFPRQLSGGQKQRVALGRAIARQPDLYLMDEPLSNLDAQLRTETRTYLVQLQKKLATTTIYVTHDQTEAMTMGDRLAVMNQGKILQVATPLEVYTAPADTFVAEFIGSPTINLIPVELHTPLLIQHDHFRCTLPEMWLPRVQQDQGKLVYLGIRPEHLRPSRPAPKNLAVQVDLIESLGHQTQIIGHLSADPTQTIRAIMPPDLTVAIGEQLWLAIDLDKIHFFDCDRGLRLNPVV